MKILLADPHPEVQSALHLILERIPEITLVSEAGSLADLLAQCAHSCPDLILLDLDLVHTSRTQPHTLSDLIGKMQRLCPDAPIVVMSSRFEAEQKAMAAGASGFISKTDSPDEVLSGIVRFFKSRS